ncbi:MAG: hypothetical protein HFF20_06720 [Oscillospiraceae bacterium]|nr:hypothetical protein [Oscillospiraceae bacterium]MCI9548899.1 hypothetical protein [Oscillospiraceae bacterium]
MSDGDVIQLEGTAWVISGTEAPWVINKNITIQGGTLELSVSGVILDADVTFRDVALSFNKPARNALIANGHTLTLDNVTCANHSFSLFCGGLINSNNEPFTVPAPGKEGTINIHGATTLQGKTTNALDSADPFGHGNIYAGNLSMGGMTEANNGPNANAPANVFEGSAVINIEGSASSSALGTVYACGAQQRIPEGKGSGKRTIPDPASYTVSGQVAVSGAVPDVHGAGSADTHVAYRDVSGNGYSTSRLLTDLSSLSVGSGHLVLNAGSGFRGQKALSIANDTKLNISSLSDPEVDSFNGGGILIMGASQTMTVTGQVTGSTKVAVGGTNHDDSQSSTAPVAGQTYIKAPSSPSTDGGFVLLPHSSAPGMTLDRDGSGNWTATNGTSGGDADPVTAFRFVDAAATTAPGEEAEFVMEATRSNGDAAYLDDVRLTVTMNWNTALKPQTDPDDNYYFIYIDTLGEFTAYVADNTFCVTALEPGKHTIQISLPSDITGGKTLSATATLTVTGDGSSTPDPTPTPKPDPTLTSISVNSTGHKTEYTVGDALDVTGLTILAAYSDRTSKTVSVTPDMVSGFDSTKAADSLTLTVAYEGQETTYSVRVAAAQTPDPDPGAPGHTHSWSDQWTQSDTHHWHQCAAQDCDITQDSQKDGYALHTPGDWIVDQEATSSQPGRKHKACTVCGRETDSEEIPATGGSTGGGSTGGGSTGGSGSTGGGSSGGGGGSYYPSTPGNTTTTTQKGPDGSTTTTSTDRTTGTVTVSVKKPDGSTVKTVTLKDGSSTTTVNLANKVTAQSTTDRDGKTQAQVTLPAQVSQAAVDSGQAVALPIPALPVTWSGGASVTIRTGSARPVKVDIPLERPAPGAVAAIVRPDGSQELVKTCVPTADGLRLAVPDGAQVIVKDNSRYFSDVGGHWARDQIDFVSARELFQGDGPTSFAPEQAMDRAMVMTVLARLNDVDTAAPSGGAWYAQAMEWAVSQGISDGSDPEGQVTREQFVTMLYRAAGSPAATRRELHFTDAPQISGYALDAMSWAVENGIVGGHGDGTLSPGGAATRAQTAAMLARYIGTLDR